MGRLPDNSGPAIIQMFWYRGTTRYSYFIIASLYISVESRRSHKKRQGVVPPYKNIEKVVAAATFSFSPCQRLARVG